MSKENTIYLYLLLPMAKPSIIASIDIGNDKIRTVIATVEKDKKEPTIIGVGVSPSTGLRKGQIIDVEETTNAISQSLEEAERMSGEPVNHVFVGLGGSHIEAIEAKGVIATQGDEIIDSDMERVLETAQAISMPQNKQVLKIIPKYFTIDSQKGIRYPVGMVGKKLEVEAHIISGLAPAIKNIEKCVHEAGVDIDDLIPNNLAAAEAVLTKRQKELGVVSIDIGHGSTSIAVFEEGALIYTSVLPVGGENVTNDIAIGVRTSLDIAEKLKLEFGSVSVEESKPGEEIKLSELTGTDEDNIQRQYLLQIIEARYYEILSMVKQELKKIRRDGMLPAGAVLSGGASKIPGILDLTKETLNLPVQLGIPGHTHGIVERIEDPSFATSIGILLWGSRMETPSYGFSIGMKQTSGAIKNIFGGASTFLKKLLP